MKFLVVTNRNIRNSSATDETLFGEWVNDRGPSEFRLAWAQRNSRGRWRLDLIEEPPTLTMDNLPSRVAFREFVAALADENRNALMYVHGYNSSFAESLQEAHEVAKRYELGVLLFSWPSNPGGFIPIEYRRAQAVASNSIVAFDRVLEKLAMYACETADEGCQIAFSLLVHSLGNLIFARFVRDPIFTGETRLFDNIVLNAADVDLRDHWLWADRLVYAVRAFAIINERDSILNISDAVNANRLGNTARDLLSARLTYVDLSEGKGIGKKHRHFEASARANRVVGTFFRRTLNGAAAFPLAGFSFDDAVNAYRLDD